MGGLTARIERADIILRNGIEEVEIPLVYTNRSLEITQEEKEPPEPPQFYPLKIRRVLGHTKIRFPVIRG